MITLIANLLWNEFAKMHRADQSDVAGPGETDPKRNGPLLYPRSSSRYPEVIMYRPRPTARRTRSRR